MHFRLWNKSRQVGSPFAELVLTCPFALKLTRRPIIRAGYHPYQQCSGVNMPDPFRLPEESCDLQQVLYDAACICHEQSFLQQDSLFRRMPLLSSLPG